MVVFHGKIMDYDHPKDLGSHDPPGLLLHLFQLRCRVMGKEPLKNDWGCRMFF